MLVPVAAEGVRVEAVLERVEDVAAAGPLSPRDDEQDDGHQQDDNRGQDHDDHADEVGVVRLLVDGAWRNYCTGREAEKSKGKLKFKLTNAGVETKLNVNIVQLNN